jgi:hypothetical protein
MAFPWTDLRLTQVALGAAPCPDACSQDVLSLVAEVRRLRAASSAAAARLSELADAAREYMTCVEGDSRPGHYTETHAARDVAAQERLRAALAAAPPAAPAQGE